MTLQQAFAIYSPQAIETTESYWYAVCLDVQLEQVTAKLGKKLHVVRLTCAHSH